MDSIFPDTKALRAALDTLAYGGCAVALLFTWTLFFTSPHELEISLLQVREGRVYQLVNPTDPENIVPATATAQITGSEGTVCGGSGKRPYEWKSAPLEFTYAHWTYSDSCPGMREGETYRADLVIEYLDRKGDNRRLLDSVVFTHTQKETDSE